MLAKPTTEIDRVTYTRNVINVVDDIFRDQGNETEKNDKEREK
jgi:hypothetical protein